MREHVHVLRHVLTCQTYMKTQQSHFDSKRLKRKDKPTTERKKKGKNELEYEKGIHRRYVYTRTGKDDTISSRMAIYKTPFFDKNTQCNILSVRMQEEKAILEANP